MTDLTSSNLANVHFALRFPRFPVLGIGAKLARLSDALSFAHYLVFAAPYAAHSEKARITEGSEAGRDPSW